uniref:MHC class I-like antigen recognition-like domain-containing protein n=1 Tax=Acanthochromis polyacanthus TaxID=80966 RepID=A0A3Q1EW85_9TELE
IYIWPPPCPLTHSLTIPIEWSKAENLLFPPVKHSLIFFITATSGVRDIPEVVAFALVDEVQMSYYDSYIGMAEPKVDWMRTFMKDNPQHMEWYVNECYETQHFIRANTESLMNHLNQTGGAHILQRISGCEWDDETGEIRGFNQFGYDGEDFIVLDLQTLTWITPKPQVFNTKLRWDADKARLENNKNYYILMCPDLLKKYLHYARSSLQRTGTITQPEIQTRVHHMIHFKRPDEPRGQFFGLHMKGDVLSPKPDLLPWSVDGSWPTMAIGLHLHLSGSSQKGLPCPPPGALHPPIRRI